MRRQNAARSLHRHSTAAMSTAASAPYLPHMKRDFGTRKYQNAGKATMNIHAAMSSTASEPCLPYTHNKMGIRTQVWCQRPEGEACRTDTAGRTRRRGSGAGARHIKDP